MPLTEQNSRRLSVVYQDVGALKARATNPRTHSPKQIAQIAKAIRRFGFINPVLVDDANFIIAGHGRIEGARAVGLDQVPTVRLSDMSEAEIRAYVIADNRLAENAGWDRALLGLELQYLSELDIDIDVTVTGFELPEIDVLIGELSAGDNDDAADAAFEARRWPCSHPFGRCMVFQWASPGMRRFHPTRDLSAATRGCPRANGVYRPSL